MHRVCFNAGAVVIAIGIGCWPPEVVGRGAHKDLWQRLRIRPSSPIPRQSASEQAGDVLSLKDSMGFVIKSEPKALQVLGKRRVASIIAR